LRRERKREREREKKREGEREREREREREKGFAFDDSIIQLLKNYDKLRYTLYIYPERQYSKQRVICSLARIILMVF